MTASITAVLQLTTALTSYLNNVKKATAEQAKVAVEASNLSGLLFSLRFWVEKAQSADPWFQQVQKLGLKDGPLDQLKDTLAMMVERISSSRKRDQIASMLVWKFKKSEVDEALQRIERLKSLINCALINDLLLVL